MQSSYRFSFSRRAGLAALVAAGLGAALPAGHAEGRPADAAPARAGAMVKPVAPPPAANTPRQLAALNAPAAVPAPPAADLPPLDAVISYESRIVNHAGVTEVRSFRNLLVRRPGHVWMQRLLPEVRAGHETEGEAHGGHKHFDFEAATQHLTRNADGSIRADYVDAETRQIVFVPPAEYSVSGFDGSWEGAAALVPEKVVLAMPRSNRPAPAGAEWREERRDGWTNRVLWSTAQHIALEIESGRDDGSLRRVTRVTPQPAMPDARLPWLALKGYQQKEYQDFLD
ncbi:hypothetical protein [Derxia gummosa]|uniref:Uncharacterized protein n=1 Tax=Derxia gummosa DSM 723 TaxID=1121388 RepID=A0A8B6XC64_9BURK|nr:hypothetical protein [Derxia gummosa]